jgi:hypothetical protein
MWPGITPPTTHSGGSAAAEQLDKIKVLFIRSAYGRRSICI